MKLLKTISTSLLAMLVLLSSMGFFVDHMVCGMSGEHKLAINTSIEDCGDSCLTTEQEEAIEETCCDYTSFYFKENIPATASQSKSERVVSAFAFVPMHQVLSLQKKCAESCCFHLVATPKVLPSVERHILLQVFLI